MADDDQPAPLGSHAAPVDDQPAPPGSHAAPVDDQPAPPEYHTAPVDDQPAPPGSHAAPVGGPTTEAPLGFWGLLWPPSLSLRVDRRCAIVNLVRNRCGHFSRSEAVDFASDIEATVFNSVNTYPEAELLIDAMDASRVRLSAYLTGIGLVYAERVKSVGRKRAQGTLAESPPEKRSRPSEE